MKTLGFVGTAKNTGKTTAALHMLDLVSAAGTQTALTSIGYDGENLDHVTGLPKPRYVARRGMKIATARGCLKIGDAVYSNLQPTGLMTILGEIVIAEVSEPGFVVLAGPNRKKDLKSLLEQLRAGGVELTLVDGALNRLAAMAAADGMLLSTGAALDERIAVIASHTSAMESLFHHPRYQPTVSKLEAVSYTSSGGAAHWLESGSLLDEDSLQKLSRWLVRGENGVCIIPGVCAPQLYQRLVEEHPGQMEEKEFVFASPLNLLASGSPLVWQSSFARLGELGGRVSYMATMPLHFITVNPFYPRYLQKTGRYLPAYVDKHELLRSARAAVKSTPVVDILQPPHPDLMGLCGLG